MIEEIDEFEASLNHLAQELGHADRHAGLKGYCSGLVLPLSRNSVEPMAAHIDPLHASAKHQSLHHFVAKAEWSDKAIMQRVREWVIPALGAHAAEEAGYYWIIDDTGFPKKGRHSVGVARQYCGQLGEQDNCQVAVSLSIATQRGSLPIAISCMSPRNGLTIGNVLAARAFQTIRPSQPNHRLRWPNCAKRLHPGLRRASCWPMRDMVMRRPFGMA